MKKTLKLFVLLAVTALSVSSLQAKEPSLEQVKQNVLNMYKSVIEAQPSVTAKDFKKNLKSDNEFILLDVRSEAEYNAAHLPGALHVERGRIEWIIPNIIKQSNRTIYVYCQDGRRSGFATEKLLEMGYINSNHISDGFEGWVKEGYLVYNMHGEFILSPGGYHKREPVIGNIGK